MKRSHTAGPWVSEEETTPEGFSTLEILQAEGHNRSITFFDKASIDDEDRANARLMAAAPDLLKACQGMLSAIEYAGTRLTGAQYHAKEELKKAVAKATSADTEIPPSDVRTCRA